MANKKVKKQLTDKQLKKVSGGWAYTSDYGGITWKYNIGNHVEIDTYWFFHQFTDGGTIRHRVVLSIWDRGYVPGYYVDGDSAGYYEEDIFDDDHMYSSKDVAGWFD